MGAGTSPADGRHADDTQTDGPAAEAGEPGAVKAVEGSRGAERPEGHEGPPAADADGGADPHGGADADKHAAAHADGGADPRAEGDADAEDGAAAEGAGWLDPGALAPFLADP